jgi:hypothetical protein
MPARIVTSTYRYKRPPLKGKAVPLTGPAIIGGKRSRRREGNGGGQGYLIDRPAITTGQCNQAHSGRPSVNPP